mgnify:FL=1
MKVGDLITSSGCGGAHLIVGETATHFLVCFTNHWRALNNNYVDKEWIFRDFEVISESRR